MTSDDTFLNFAYGSNLLTACLRERVSPATPAGTGRLESNAL